MCTDDIFDIFEYNSYIVDTKDDILYIYIQLYIFIHTSNGDFILLTILVD